MKVLGWQELLAYLEAYGLCVRVTRGVHRLVKPDAMDSEAYQRHAEYLLPSLKANKRAFAGQYDPADKIMNGVESFKDLHPSRKREVLFERFKLRAAACAGRIGWVSWYTRLTGWVDPLDVAFPRDATRACVAVGDVIVEDWRDLPGHTFPVVWQGTKPGVWHVPPRIALKPPDGCIVPADYHTPAFVAAAAKKERAERYKAGWKAELSWKDSLPPD